MRWRPRPWYEEGEPDSTLTIDACWRTALHRAAQEGRGDYIRSLTTYGDYINSTARHVLVCRSWHMRLIIHGERIREPGSAPITTPLHAALAIGCDSTARLLVELRADWSQEIILQDA